MNQYALNCNVRGLAEIDQMLDLVAKSKTTFELLKANLGLSDQQFEAESLDLS